jgi:hypothetical protein
MTAPDFGIKKAASRPHARNRGMLAGVSYVRADGNEGHTEAKPLGSRRNPPSSRVEVVHARPNTPSTRATPEAKQDSNSMLHIRHRDAPTVKIPTLNVASWQALSGSRNPAQPLLLL